MSNRSPISNLLMQAASAASRLRRTQLDECLDPANLASRPTEKQLEWLRDISKIQFRYIISGNQAGKTSGAIRDLVWFIRGIHPYFVKPKAWGNEPYLIIVAGQDRAQLDTMWVTRILPLLGDADDWHSHRAGGALQYAEHKKLGHRIIFLSHNLGSDADLTHMQNYPAHYVWLDEMPKSVRVLEELQRRTDAKNSPFIVTFTQKVRNDAIRRYVEALDPRIGRIYRMGKLDNPIYFGREEEELAKLEGLSESLREAILHGTWITSDTSVYEFVHSLHGGIPVGYSQNWRHVASFDPATRSNSGLTLWAEDPQSHMWWCVSAEYVKGNLAPRKLVLAVEKRLVGLNIIKRRYDAASAWFGAEARDMGFDWQPCAHKSGRKEEMIAGFQTALGDTIRISDWADPLVSEIQDFERSESDPTRFVKAQKYHLLDSAHYFADNIPPPEEIVLPRNYDTYVFETHMRRREIQEAARKQQRGRSIFRRKWIRY